MSPSPHKSGFVNIIGHPNVGKSTLMNQLVGEKMSIITAKPQTTRHRIIGIVSDPSCQIVFSDTPGFIMDPAYKMQHAMNTFVGMSFEDGDVLLFVTDLDEKYEKDDPLLNYIRKSEVPRILILNKTDKYKDVEVLQALANWQKRIPFDDLIPISALKGHNTDRLIDVIKSHLPEGPAYYPKDQLTDRPERFFISEIIREKILELFHQEIPYSCEVNIESFKEKTTNSGEPIVHIGALIFVNRKSQKSILIGKNGSAIKKLGMEARKDIETWLERKVFLELFVKIRENWRDDEKHLRRFGYQG